MLSRQDNDLLYRQRFGEIMLPLTEDWWEATRELRKAFVEHERLAAMARPTIEASAGSQASRLVAIIQIN